MEDKERGASYGTAHRSSATHNGIPFDNRTAAHSLFKPESLLDYDTTAIAVVDRGLRLQAVNNSFCKLLDREREELLGQNAFAAIPQAERLGLRRILREVIESGAQRRLDPFDIPYLNTEARFFSIDLVPLCDGKRGVYGVLISARNVTERVLLEKQLEVALEEAEGRAGEVERILSGLSHNFNQLLEAIRASGQILARHALRDGSELRSLGQRLDQSAEAMARIAGLLEGLSRTLRTPGDSTRTSIGEILRRVRRTVPERVGVPATSLKLHRRYPKLSIDPEHILEVFSRLVENALRYRRDNAAPHVEVGWQLQPDRHLFFVKDNGIGIPRRWHQRIFEPFARTPEAERLDPHGTGVGLAIAKRIVEMYGGSIWLESKLGRGSTFYFDLPRA